MILFGSKSQRLIHAPLSHLLSLSLSPSFCFSLVLSPSLPLSLPLISHDGSGVVPPTARHDGIATGWTDGYADVQVVADATLDQNQWEDGGGHVGGPH